MTTAIIITFCSLLLLAYLFDISSSKTKIPSVVLLLLLGWSMQQVAGFFSVQLPDFSEVLPVLGTVGLIMIVLEGSLELELNRSKVQTIRKAFLGSIASVAVLALALTCAFMLIGLHSTRDSLLNAIPICVISSSIAIPSARHLSAATREYIVYESSFSDILGVILFNFVLVNEVVDAFSFLQFGLQFLVMIIVSFVATLGLAYFLHRIQGHVKFVPIILMIFLIYAISKLYHLPSLLFILVFGLFIGNLDELRHLKWIKRFRTETLTEQTEKFKELVAEATFLMRALFFLLFGYSLQTAEIVNMETLPWSLGIVGLIFLLRTTQLALFKYPLNPAVFIAPRGLINILLLLTIAPENLIPLVNKSLITQIILLTSFILMIGLMAAKPAEQR